MKWQDSGLYASVRCQRTQARSCPLSSSRAKATAAGGSDNSSSGVVYLYTDIYRLEDTVEGWNGCRWRHTDESQDTEG